MRAFHPGTYPREILDFSMERIAKYVSNIVNTRIENLDDDTKAKIVAEFLTVEGVTFIDDVLELIIGKRSSP